MDKPDWRIGLKVKPAYKDSLFYGGSGVVLDAHPNGYKGLQDQEGILEIKIHGMIILDEASKWVTA